MPSTSHQKAPVIQAGKVAPPARKAPARPAAATAAKPTLKPTPKTTPIKPARPARPAARKARPAPNTPAAVVPASALALPPARRADGRAKPVFKPLAVLGFEDGVFILMVVGTDSEKIKAFARYVEQPIPHLLSDEKNVVQVLAFSNYVIYAAHMHWPDPPDGAMKMALVTESGRKALFDTTCIPMIGNQAGAVAEIIRKYGRVLVPVMRAVIPAHHDIWKRMNPVLVASSKKPPATDRPILGVFDGIIDNLAQGWLWNPHKPDQKLEVQVISAGQVMGRGIAAQHRKDLEKNGIGDGNYHFKIALSYELFDGKPHEISVQETVTGVKLSGSPVSHAFENTKPAGFHLITREEGLAFLRTGTPGKSQSTLLAAYADACLDQETMQVENARDGYRHLQELLPQNALLCCKLAETYWLERRYDEAEEYYSSALKIDPRYFNALIGLGDIHRHNGALVKAGKAYAKALALQPHSTLLHERARDIKSGSFLQQAEAAIADGNTHEAIALLSAAMVHQPENEAVCMELDSLLLSESGNAGDDETAMFSDDEIERVARSCRLLNHVLDRYDRPAPQ